MRSSDEEQALIFATGDIIVDEPNPYSFFAPSKHLLSIGDFVVGQIEVPHTDRGESSSTDIPAPPAPPENLEPLKACGFNLCSTCGLSLIHIWLEKLRRTAQLFQPNRDFSRLWPAHFTGILCLYGNRTFPDVHRSNAPFGLAVIGLSLIHI